MQEDIIKIATKSQRNEFINLLPLTVVCPPAQPGADDSQEGQALISCPFQVVNFSYDTFHLSFDIQNNNKELLERIDLAKKSLQLSSMDTEIAFSFNQNGSQAFQWNLQRVGNRLYPFVFRCGDLSFGLSTRKAGSQVPNMFLKIGSLSCNQDISALLKTFKFWLGCLDIHVISEKVTRADLCCDIVNDIKKGFLDRAAFYITQARDHSQNYSNRKFTGITFGRGQIVCRIYDKQLEMQQKQSIEKAMFFYKLWNVAKDTPITRVEFQMRREAITQFFKGKTDVAVFLNRKIALWQYFTEKWLRHCSKFVDRENKNQSRAENSIFWSAVCSAADSTVVKVVRKRSQLHINIPALRAQAAGIFTTIAAGLGHAVDDVASIVCTVCEILEEDIINKFRKIETSKLFQTKQLNALVSF